MRVDLRRVAAAAFVTLVAAAASASCTSFANLSQPLSDGGGTDDGAEGPKVSDDGGSTGRDGSDSGKASGDACAARAAYAASVLEDQPLAYFQFEQDTGGTTSSSVGSQTCGLGISTGSIPRSEGALPCTAGLALTAGLASKSIRCADGNFDFPSKPFTVEAWVNPHLIDGTDRFIVTNYDGNGYKFGLVDGDVGPKLFFDLYNTGAKACGLLATVARDKWQHVVAVFDGSSVTIYVDGKPTRTGCDPKGSGHSNSAAVIGSGVANEGKFEGGIDEVAIYGTALGEARVTAHFAAAAAN